VNSVESRQSWSLQRVLLALTIVSVVGWLVSREAGSWIRSDWGTFWVNARQISAANAISALALIYASLLLRAFRWRLFLQSAKQVPTTRLFAATIVGFTGLALLGRAGELVRPYLIARQEDLTVSSQIAVLALERIFDVAAAALLIAIAIGTSSEVRSLPYLAQFRHAGFLLLTALAIAAFVTLVLAMGGRQWGAVLERILSPLSSRLARRISDLISRFCADLNRMRDARSLVAVTVVSLLIWAAIGFAHLECVHAFVNLQYISVADAFLLLGFSLLGSLVQLPGGGAQQVAFVAALVHVFGVPLEFAVSCTILGWLLLFMAPVPVGLALLRRQHLSLKSMEQSASSCAS
jgi:uncharacterized protein (TIRG00374 family)